jgi:predicted DsbA family dithiol-disulfide isomerase
MTAVDFYFDIMCPWAYQASKWIRAVRAERDVKVTWRFFSLEESGRKEGKKHPWERPWSYGWSLLRIAALLRREVDGNDAVDRFYAVAGRMFHEEGTAIHTRDGIGMVIAELGHEPSIAAEAIGSEWTNDEVRADHDRALRLNVFGVPTLVIDDADVLFGPVVAPAPTGAAACRLWDAVTAWREFPHLYELQRPKSAEEQAHIQSLFEPYAVARAQGLPASPAGGADNG